MLQRKKGCDIQQYIIERDITEGALTDEIATRFKRKATPVCRLNFVVAQEVYEDLRDLADQQKTSMTRMFLTLLENEMRRSGRDPTWAK